jgi:hypothetical protein
VRDRGEGLGAHHAGQHGEGLDLVIVKERLHGWIKGGLDGQP